MKHINISISFDMRAPDWGAPRAELYGAAVEMAAFADKIGVASINLMEHHGSEDGYLPQPFLLASAMAAVTSKINFSLGAVILPLHDPVIVAEQIAVLDLISGGRCRVIFGAGYVPGEFAMFNTTPRDRAKRLDAGIEIILRALRGERFEFEGRPVFVRPLPSRDPAEIIMAGGAVPASARRAARFDIGLGPMNAETADLYVEECKKLGQKPRTFFRPVPGMPLGVHLCEDPEAGLAGHRAPRGPRHHRICQMGGAGRRCLQLPVPRPERSCGAAPGRAVRRLDPRHAAGKAARAARARHDQLPAAAGRPCAGGRLEEPETA